MFDLDNWQEIWATITRNKFRSFLTGFGVFWGLFMLIILVGLGNAFEGGISKNFSGFAKNSCFFYTGLTSEPYKGYRKGRSWDMNNRDIYLIRQKAQSVEHVSPMLFGSQTDRNTVRGLKSGSYGQRGVYPDHFKIEKPEVLRGRLFNNIDIESYRKSCIIGKEIYETLFNKGEDPIGQYIRVRGIYFQVIGVIRPTTKVSIGGDVEATVFFPFSTMQRTFNQGDVIHFLGCTAKPGYPASMVEEEVKNIVKTAHQISPTDEKAMSGINIEKQFQMFDALFTGIGVLIWIVGIFALASGIIGISNIMMVTVRERTNEIGVRRAIGAKPSTILRQILSESFILTFLAGISGMMVGIGILQLINSAMVGNTGEDFILIPPFVSFGTVMKAFVILLISGVSAGLMPALRAMKIKAIDAIREE